jgi:antitoxin component YwqK of YwqJK toxin-antitoxin module
MKPRTLARAVWALALLLAAGLLSFVAVRHRPMLSDKSGSSDKSPQATHRTNLVLQAGHWLLAGTTNLFTGLLLDTYEDGLRKSLSAVTNGLLHGLSTGWHTNGQQQVEEHFVAGVSHGPRIKWHPSGQKLSEVMIIDGQLHGTFRRWDESGTLTEEIEMKAGQPDGLSRAYYPSGALKTQVRLEQGRVIERQSWHDGEKPALTQPPAG